MDKPSFDPNKPFEPASSAKPAFDPNKAFEKPSAEEPSMLEKLASNFKDAGKTIRDKANAIATGVQSGAYLDYRPQLLGARDAVDNMVLDQIPGTTPSGDSGSFADRYLKNRDKILHEQEQIKKENPYSYGAGQIAGSVAIPLPGSAETALGKIGLGAARGAGIGALMNPGDKAGEINPLQLDERSGNAMVGGVTGGALEGVIQGAPWVAKKGINTVLGVSEGAVSKYLANRERINSAPTLATLKDTIDEQVGGLNNKVLRSEANVSNARANLAESKARLASEQKAQSLDYRAGAAEAKNEAQLAKAQVGEQTTMAQAELNQTPHPRVLAGDVHQAVGVLKDQVTSGSAASRDILAKSGTEIQTQPILDSLRQSMEKMFGDTPPITPQAQAEHAQLTKLYEDLSKLPPTLKGETAKNVVQQIDEQASFNREAGGFGSGIDHTLKGIRKGIDSQLKGNEEYAKQMAVVAEKTGLLEKANQLFGTPERANSALGTIASDSKLPQRETLKALGAHVGQDFHSPIENYSRAQQAIKGGFTPVEAGRAAEKASTLDDILSAPGYRESRISSAVEDSGIPKEVSSKEAELQHLQSQLGMTQAEAQPFSGWSPRSTQNKLESLRSKAPDRASIEAGRELSMLNEMRAEGQPDYLTAIDDNRVRNEFSTDKTRGSRNVNLGKGVGGAIGGIAGYLTHIPYAWSVGAGAGGAAGAVVDKYGGAMAKKSLDTYLNNKGSIDFVNQNAQKAVAPWLLMTKKDEK